MTPVDRPNRCTIVREQIEPFLDDELDLEQRSAFEAHVAACAGCRRELEAARRVLSELRSLPSLECPPQVRDRVVAAAGEQNQNGGKASAWHRLLGRNAVFRPALVGLLVVIVTVSSIIVTRWRDAGSDITPQEAAQATADLKWALAYVNEVGRQTGRVVRDDAIEAAVVAPMEKAVRSAFDADARSKPKRGGGHS